MAKYTQYILKFEGIVGTEEEIAVELGLSVENLRSRIYRKHNSVREIVVGSFRIKGFPRDKKEVVHDLTCAECGKQFQFHRKKKVCSLDCRATRSARATLEYQRANPKPRIPKEIVAKECLRCGKEFLPESSHVQKYCSKRCVNYMQWKRTSDLLGAKVRHGLAMKISRLLRNEGRSKTTGFFKYVGMDAMSIYKRITSLMDSDMTVENYGPLGWHIDHVIPRSLFDMSREDHVYLCFNWRNLRPLWRKDNFARSNRVIQSDIDFVGPEYLKEVESAGIVVALDESATCLTVSSEMK